MSKKKFKDTKVGKFITEKLPGIAGDLLPEKGVLGIVKNLIDKDEQLTPEDKKQMHDEIVEVYQLEVSGQGGADISVNQSIVGNTTKASGIIARVDGNVLYVRLKTSQFFEKGEGVTLSDDTALNAVVVDLLVLNVVTVDVLVLNVVVVFLLVSIVVLVFVLVL